MFDAAADDSVNLEQPPPPTAAAATTATTDVPDIENSNAPAQNPVPEHEVDLNFKVC